MAPTAASSTSALATEAKFTWTGEKLSGPIMKTMWLLATLSWSGLTK
eukprot:CAMPEP_0170472316 /NCGR_PEP_ID=MMETSP0123-20130129/14368_1 /TAXON_ID=182087 /ORGANISM="Favella ehrenbergii, Strain Fehren 1" /LENGTH=46 /DNA_ID= /DNA_START= /DNA_END= /DNA_ORIENTATION=